MKRYCTVLVLCKLIFCCYSSMAQPNWKAARCDLPTAWTAEVSPTNALPEYPRPQMTRKDWLNLNGEWRFQVMDNQQDKIIREAKILVPYPVESALSGIKTKVEPHHLLIYKRPFTVPPAWKGKRVLLHFGAVDWEAEVYLNGKKVGSHKGGYDPFSFDITDYLSPGQGTNQLSVQVKDPTDSGSQPVGKQRLKPSGIWYTATSGIWQTVWLEPVPETYVKSLRIEPDAAKGRVVVRVEVAGENKNNTQVMARILENGKALSSATGKTAGTPLLLNIRKGARLWSPDDPFLYDLEISLGKGKAVDHVKSYFGLRNISLGKDEKGITRLLLNNQPLFQLGPLDQGFFPDGLYTPPTYEAMEQDLVSMKKMGFNMIRKHVKIEPARWYYMCDTMGILVWQDMPSGTNKSKEDQRQFKYELKSMVDYLFNHPSIVMWVPFNEGWGQHDTEFYVEKLKEWDPTRLVNNASGWTDTGTGDVSDIHAYPGPATPEPEENRALVLGEFGGLGYNVKGHQWSGQGWGYELIDSPEKLLFTYENLYQNLWALVDSAGLSAAVYTQVSDIETENNGLMTYDREVIKMDPALLSLVHGGYLPPTPAHPARIFVKNTEIRLKAQKPGATITYTLDGLSPAASWQTYSAPIMLKKSGVIRCKASWPDGKASHSQEYSFTKVKPLKAQKPKNPEPGALVKIYEGTWDQLPDFSALTAVKEMTTESLSPQGIELNENFALSFEGFIEIMETGVYTFHVSSDDGSALVVAGQPVLSNDGLHGMREKSGSIALKKGKHPFSLHYFQKAGGMGLKVSMRNDKGQPEVLHLFH